MLPRYENLDACIVSQELSFLQTVDLVATLGAPICRSSLFQAKGRGVRVIWCNIKDDLAEAFPAETVRKLSGRLEATATSTYH